jgi:hypothetical protein
VIFVIATHFNNSIVSVSRDERLMLCLGGSDGEGTVTKAHQQRHHPWKPILQQDRLQRQQFVPTLGQICHVVVTV